MKKYSQKRSFFLTADNSKTFYNFFYNLIFFNVFLAIVLNIVSAVQKIYGNFFKKKFQSSLTFLKSLLNLKDVGEFGLFSCKKYPYYCFG